MKILFCSILLLCLFSQIGCRTIPENSPKKKYELEEPDRDEIRPINKLTRRAFNLENRRKQKKLYKKALLRARTLRQDYPNSRLLRRKIRGIQEELRELRRPKKKKKPKKKFLIIVYGRILINADGTFGFRRLSDSKLFDARAISSRRYYHVDRQQRKPLWVVYRDPATGDKTYPAPRIKHNLAEWAKVKLYNSSWEIVGRGWIRWEGNGVFHIRIIDSGSAYRPQLIREGKVPEGKRGSYFVIYRTKEGRDRKLFLNPSLFRTVHDKRIPGVK